jgi:uncharacterized oxidoreductase
MQLQGNTILITGGGSGIGRGLAEAFHALGNQVVIAGRRRQALDEVTASNPGMASLVLDIESPASIGAFAAQVAKEHPSCNVLINNAGVMQPEKLAAQPADSGAAESMITTNLLGPIRLTSALLPTLQKQPRSAVMNVSSGLAFVPLVMTPTYSATKAAIHSYTLSLRLQLAGTTTEVIELIPPWVATELLKGGTTDPRAMPLPQFISQVMEILKNEPDAKEICVENVKALRFAAEAGRFEKIFQGMNADMGH